MDKKVSVIMAAYNESDDVLTESIDSILNQTYSNLELIIVCDNPNNYSLIKKLQEYAKDKRVTLLINEKNGGPAFSRNRAIQNSTGDYLAIMDADDISLPNRFEKQVSYLDNHKDCCLVASNRDNIDENSNITKKSASFIVSDKSLSIISKYCSIITHSSVMFRSQAIKELGYYRLTDGEEYDLWLRMLTKGYKLHIMPEVLIKYRIRTNSITRINYSKQYYSSLYIRALYKERIKNSGKDSCSQDDLRKLQNHNPKEAEEINHQYQQLLALSQKKDVISNIIKICLGIVRYPSNIHSLRNHLFTRILLKLAVLENKIFNC